MYGGRRPTSEASSAAPRVRLRTGSMAAGGAGMELELRGDDEGEMRAWHSALAKVLAEPAGAAAAMPMAGLAPAAEPEDARG